MESRRNGPQLSSRHDDDDQRVSGLGSRICSLLQAVNPSGDMGPPSPFGTIPVSSIHREPQVFDVVLDDVGPSLSLSSSTPLSMDVCLEDSFDTVIFSPLYMPRPSQPGLTYLQNSSPRAKSG